MKYKPHMAALAAGVGLMAFATPAMANYGDVAVKQDAPEFRLNPYTLEPGCFQIGDGYRYRDVDADSHIDVQQLVKEAHITVDEDANFSIDQALIPGRDTGYNVYNTFDTGTSDSDEDIDPNQTATDLAALDGDDVDYSGKIIVCVSDHPSEQNEPYVSDGLPGEVAAINRPVIQPLLACIGSSAIEPLNTYKVGFGYGVEDWYDTYWADQFRNDGVFGPGLSFGDPQAFDTDGDDHFDHVFIKNRAEQDGVRRFNDFDEFGEQFNDPHSEKTSYGQPVVFHMNGDPYAYLHKSLPGTVDGGGIGAVWAEALADQTSALGLLTFTAQGDLPLEWHLKASLAPEAYARSVMLDDAALRAWEASWQAYYDGTAARPATPLCPGTNSPADNGREAAPAPAPAPAGPSTTNTITREVTTVQTVAGATQVVKSAAAKATKKAKKAKAKKASCMKKAKAKKSKKARKNAMKKCRRIK